MLAGASRSPGSNGLLLRSIASTPAVARLDATIVIDFGPRLQFEMFMCVIADDCRVSERATILVMFESIVLESMTFDI